MNFSAYSAEKEVVIYDGTRMYIDGISETTDKNGYAVTLIQLKNYW